MFILYYHIPCKGLVIKTQCKITNNETPNFWIEIFRLVNHKFMGTVECIAVQSLLPFYKKGLVKNLISYIVHPKKVNKINK